MQSYPRRGEKQPGCAPGSCFVTPAQASILSGFTPYEIRDLALNFDPRVGDEPIVRSTHFEGRFLVSLADIMLIVGALEDGRAYR